jgi:catechol 2,3-dioxygenase-like lactoylglutathione lyase family enzyme
MSKIFHLALSVSDLEASVKDYSRRLGAQPTLVIPNQYALWRTNSINLSIRVTKETPQTLRHLGWEDSEATEFSMDTDVNGILWERFSSIHQDEEIEQIWPQKKSE